MDNLYRVKVAFFRMSLITIISICYLLFKYSLTDYIILISFIVLFIGIFSISKVSFTNREVIIKKNYFWGLIGLQWKLNSDQITSVTSKEYEIEDNSSDESFSSYFIPALRWKTSKIYYRENGTEKDIELKLSKDEFRAIERRIKRV